MIQRLRAEVKPLRELKKVKIQIKKELLNNHLCSLFLYVISKALQRSNLAEIEINH